MSRSRETPCILQGTVLTKLVYVQTSTVYKGCPTHPTPKKSFAGNSFIPSNLLYTS